MFVQAMIVVTATLLTYGCSEKKDPSSTEDADDGATDGQEPGGTGTLAIEAHASEVMLVTSNALSSASEGDQFGALSADTLSPGTLAVAAGDNNSQASLLGGENGPSEANPNCSGNGHPFDEDGNALESGDPGFILKSFYCLLNDKNSPDVVLGAIEIARGFICMAERQEGFGYSEAGTKVSVSYDNVLAHEDAQACFPKETLSSAEDESEEEGGGGAMAFSADITGYKLSEGPWTHRVNMIETTESDDDHQEPEDTYFVVTEDKAAYKRGDISASLDFANGILRFENLETEHGRHTRFLVHGEMGKDGKFSAVSKMQAIQSQVGSSVLTVKGTADSGYTYSEFFYDCADCSTPSEGEGSAGEMVKTTGGTWKYLGSECLGTGGACAQADGIVFSTDSDVPFIATNNSDLGSSQVSPWRANHGPLCFDEVTTDLIPAGDCKFLDE